MSSGCGVWLSLVERYVRDVEAAGSNPVTPILGCETGIPVNSGVPVSFLFFVFSTLPQKLLLFTAILTPMPCGSFLAPEHYLMKN